MLVVRTYLAEVCGKGIGLFAAEPIPKGAIWWKNNSCFDMTIHKENAELMPPLAKEFLNRAACLREDGSWLLCVDDARFVNHSHKPNTAESNDGSGDWIAAVDIAVGEEIVSDYRNLCETCKNGLPFDDKEQLPPTGCVGGGVCIRPIREGELVMAEALVDREWPSYSGGFRKEVLDIHSDKDGCCYVALRGQEMIGVGIVTVSMMSYLVWNISWLVVSASNRGHGVGKSLVHQMEHHAMCHRDTREPALSICLTTSVQDFYRKLGYAESAKFSDNKQSMMWKNLL